MRIIADADSWGQVTMNVAWRRWLAFGLLWLFVLPAVVACDGSGSPAFAEARSDKERITAPAVTEEQLAEFVGGNSAFAFEFYRAVRDDDGNLFFSPYSISAALAMTYAGARGETAREMAEALNYVLPREQLHSAFNAMDLELALRSEVELEEEGDPFRLNIANAVWGEREYEFLAEFLDTLAENYGAGLQLLDFISDPEGAREAINRWVSDQTEDRIPELIPQGAIDALTRLVLTNAIYFNASWAFPFEREATQEGTFHLLDGTQVQVPMMRLDETVRYAEVDGVEAVELPYVGRQLSMVVLVPDEGQFEAFESALDAATMDSALDAMKPTRVALTMPKFEFESSFTLNDTLASMGMPSAFTPGQADFSGMDGTRDLFITHILHKAFVSVDEAGTEAAAATAVIVGLTSAPSGPVELALDRPFTFFIRDIPTGAILFAGRVLDPESQ